MEPWTATPYHIYVCILLRRSHTTHLYQPEAIDAYTPIHHATHAMRM